MRTPSADEALKGSFQTGEIRTISRKEDGTDAPENVIEASWLALLDSLHFKLMRDAVVASQVKGGTGTY